MNNNSDSKGTTPIDFSEIGDELSRFLKRLSEPCGQKLFNEFKVLIGKEFPDEVRDLKLFFPWMDNQFSLGELPVIEKTEVLKRIAESIKVEDWARDLILAPEFMLLPQATPEKLILISPRELGVTDGKVSIDSLFRMIENLSGITYCTPFSALMTIFERPIEANTIFGFKPMVIPKRDTHKHVLRLSEAKLSAIRVYSDRHIFPDEKILVQVL